MRWPLRCTFALLAALFTVAPPASADPLAELSGYFEDVETLEGRFEQTVKDERGEVLERSRGSLAIERPDRFEWVYETPFEQRIVADGERLWIHDVDLEQVTVRPLKETLGSGPALLLSGRLETLEEQFTTRVDGGWIELEPRDSDWQMEAARLRMEDGLPREVIVIDGLGQENRLVLEDLARDVAFGEERFRFEPEPGMDVIEQGAP